LPILENSAKAEGAALSRYKPFQNLNYYPIVILSAAKNLFFQGVEILHSVQDDKKTVLKWLVEKSSK
jgi:hypothetical protein